MLQVFRDHAHKWFVKLLFWILVLSFGLWGIGDVIYKFLTHRPVVKVGKHTISQEELSHNLQKEHARIQEATKGKIPQQELKALGVHNSVINRLVNHLLVSDQLEKMDMGTSDEALKEQIHNMPAFKTDGQFDPEKFLSALNQQSMSEANFLKEARYGLLAQQLFSSISLAGKLPESYTNSLIDALMREKVFAIVEIRADRQILDQTASAEQIESYYEQNKNKYIVPEYRDVTVLVLDNKALRQILGITDSQIFQSYESKKENLKYPERRDINGLTYTQEDKAQKAIEMAEKGVSLKKIEKEIPGGEFEKIGLVGKQQLPAFAAEEVFTLQAGKTTKVIRTGFGFHIFEVNKIEQPRIATFEEVKGELESQIIQEQKSVKLDEIRSQIDDAIAAGQSLSDVAAKLKLTAQTFEVDAQGKNAEGKSVLTVSKGLSDSIIEKAFSIEQGLDSGFVDVTGEGAFVLTVNKVNSAHDPEFSKIERKVRKDWEMDEKLELASRLAALITSEAKSLNALVNLSNKHNLTLSTNLTLSRFDIGNPERKSYALFPVTLAEKAFMLAPEKAIAGPNETGGFTVVMLQKVGDIKASKKEIQDLLSKINNMFQEDICAATINSLKEQHKIEINQEMLSQMME